MIAPQRGTLPPDPEEVSAYFLQSLVTPTNVVTKLEDADDISDIGAVRVESANVVPILQFRSAAWDMSFLIHAYSPNEIEAMRLGLKCIGHAASVRGQTIMGWFVVDVLNVVGAVKLPEPGVEGLTRYRGAVTWRIAGHSL